jgi:DNA-binding transcriptional regulator YhcF (GntR family)
MGVLDEDDDRSTSRGVGAQNHLEESIRTGRLPVGMKLPSQRALATQYGVVKSTMQAIVLNLTRKGLIRTEPGRGTYVAPRHASDLVRLGEIVPDGRGYAISRMELSPDEAKALEFIARRRTAEMVGLFFMTVGDIFAGASFVNVSEGAPNETVVEWVGGPRLRDVVAEVMPHRGKSGSMPWGGMPGLRAALLEAEDATFVWIPELTLRLVLRRKIE